MCTHILCGLLILLATVAYFMLSKWRKSEENRVQSTDSSKSILIVVGSGGHTREILGLVKVLGGNYQPRFYVIADTDKMSETKVLECEKECNVQHKIFHIPRSREVKQSYITSVITTLKAIYFCVPLLINVKPDIILCNGPGTCIPICAVGLILKWLHVNRTMIIYVESLCRVKSLSLSGKLLYYFADNFFVQWPELVVKYPKTKYLGRF